MNADDNILNHIIIKPEFERLKKLALSYNDEITDETIHNIAASDIDLNLECLEMDGTGITDEGIRTLASSLSFRGLKELDLSDTSITDKTIEYLAQTLSTLKLTHLQIQSTNINDFSLPLFAQFSKFSKLRSLHFSNLEISNFQKFWIFCNRSPYSFFLKKLTLKNCGIKTHHIGIISQSKNLSYLEYLDLSGNDLEDQISPYLFRAKFQLTLRHLLMSRNRISHKFLKELSKSKCYTNLEGLGLTYCPSVKNLKGLSWSKSVPFSVLYISKVGSSQNELSKLIARHFLHLRKLKLDTISGVIDWHYIFRKLKGTSALTVLKLSELIDNKALKALFTQVNFCFLERFKLSNKQNFDKGTMEIICFSQKFPRLNALNLKYNRMSDEEVSCITSSPNFPMLKLLNLRGNNISIQCAKTLIESENLPFLEVVIFEQERMLNKY